MRIRSGLTIVMASLTLIGAACAPTTGGGGGDTTTSTTTTWSVPGPGNGVRLNQIQLVGTHNSYHIGPIPHLLQAYNFWIATLGSLASGFGDVNTLAYTHAPLATQLDTGVRSFELDVWADPVGGVFSHPNLANLLLVPEAPQPVGVGAAGFKVLHIVDLDWTSTCSTLVLCLQQINAWSNSHPGHLPIVINIELKDDPLPAPLNITPIVKIDGPQMDALDAEIRSVLSPSKLLTPDDVRGDAATLNAAITTTGWPTVDSTRGKVMFFMDNSGSYRTDYLAGHPSLQGRVLFTSSGEGQPDGAVLKENDPGNGAHIHSLVQQGYFVRTRADENLVSDTTRRDTAFASGAQVVSTDYPVGEPKASDGFTVALGAGTQARCNPVNSPLICNASDTAG